MQFDEDFARRIGAVVREELAREADAGFPKLSRVPSSGIIKFLDYFSALPAFNAGELIDAFARLGALCFFPAPLIAKAHEQLRTTNAAILRYGEALRSPRFVHGFRYSDLRMTRAMLNDPESMMHLKRTRATLDFEPRDDFPSQILSATDPRQVATAKAPMLRKLLNPMLRRRLGVKGMKQPGGEMVYDGAIGNVLVKVRIIFSNMYAQMHYGATFIIPERKILAQRLTYETLWGMNAGWDFLTEENAPRSIELLDELLMALAQLVGRVVALPQ